VVLALLAEVASRGRFGVSRGRNHLCFVRFRSPHKHFILFSSQSDLHRHYRSTLAYQIYLGAFAILEGTSVIASLGNDSVLSAHPTVSFHSFWNLLGNVEESDSLGIREIFLRSHS
ncbi:hypothetical protein PMAYCL1PPCAC_29694, partial [Pristionchus mayeri]